MKNRPLLRGFAVATAGVAAAGLLTQASSHREAPLITSAPRLDCTDFYMFNSYETGRSNHVTIIANYLPLQDAYGGPNYFKLAEVFDGRYEIHVDNNADAQEDITFQFRFTNTSRDIALPIGPPGDRRTNAVSLVNVGPINATNSDALNVVETYQVDLIAGNRRTGAIQPVTNAITGSTVFTKPVDNIGNKSLPDYDAYAQSFIYEIALPGHPNGRMFVGQRKDPFVVNLGETFDLVNISTSPLGPVDANKDSLYDKNVTSIILEMPRSFLTGTNPVIAAWTTASKITRTNTMAAQLAKNSDGVGKQNHNVGVTYAQMSRLGHPLVNEVVIGLRDKDRFNASEPKDDSQFLDYVTHPTLPAILELLYGSAGVAAPTLFPRNDLVAVFLTGVDGLNRDGSVGEMLRLNTSLPAMPAAQQSDLGVIGGDTAGFPNGRRPGDDVVDIALRVVMGKLLSTNDAPSGQLPFTDGARVHAGMFSDRFPYLNPPVAGSPNDPSINVTLQSAAPATGPFRSIPAAYDPATQKLTGAKPSESMGYYRLKADGKVDVDGISVQDDSAVIGLRK